MKTLKVVGPERVELLDVDLPIISEHDILVAVRACGICGTDSHFWRIGHLPGFDGPMPLGHEIAGEVAEVGAAVSDVAVGQHVVVNPMADPDGVIGCGGPRGGLSEFVVLKQARAGRSFRVVPDEIPWEVAALNEPMAVAYHGVNRSGAGAGTKAVVFGAGPVGLGAAIGLKSKGAEHVIVIDVVPNRLEKALAVGADAVINSATEDVTARLREFHGVERDVLGGEHAGTDVYIDAAGVPEVVQTALANIKARGVLTIIAVHKREVSIDFEKILTVEADIRMSMGYPTEIFEVTDSIIANWRRYQHIISDVLPFTEAARAVELASTPGAADKVVVRVGHDATSAISSPAGVFPAPQSPQ